MFNRTANASSNAARHRNVPRALPLTQQPFRRASGLPQSPLKENIMITEPLMSPSAIFTAFSPVSITPSLHRRRLEDLTQCLTSNVPSDGIYPSFGQIGEEAKRISTFLDLYRVNAREDASMNVVKSPSSREAGYEWPALSEIASKRQSKRASARRSRSLDNLRAPAAPMAPRGRRESRDDIAVLEPPPERVYRSLRSKSIESAKASIINADAERMDQFRKRFTTRPRDPRLRTQLILIPPAPSAPLPSPPPHASLLEVKSPPASSLAARRRPKASGPPRIVTSQRGCRSSPRSPPAPYWVKRPRTPKTPRTIRTERRQGWGGSWNRGGIGQVVNQLKETC